MPAEGQLDKMVSDTKVHLKQRCGIEFLHAEKNGTCWHSPTFAECLWTPTVNGEWSRSPLQAVFYEHSIHTHNQQKCIASGGAYLKKQCFLIENLNSVINVLCML